MANPVCEKCKNEISPIDVVSCPNCDKKYHSWCWMSVPNCIGCGTFNKDYMKEKINKATVNINTNVKDRSASNEKVVAMDSGMFSNIGGKMQGLAIIVTIIGIIAGIIVFISNIAIDEELFFTGLLSGVAIALVSWIGSFALYGFGALILSSQSTERLLREILKEIKK